MKHIMTALVLMTIAQTATAAKLERSDFMGRRMMVFDQQNQLFTGLMTIDENFVMELQGQTGGASLNCKGAGIFWEDKQTISSAGTMKCTGGQIIRMTLSLSNSDEDITYLLQNGLTSASLEVTALVPETREYTNVLYSGAVDIKRLAK